MASKGVVALVNNGLDVKKALNELGKQDSVNSILTSMVTAGVLQSVGDVTINGTKLSDINGQSSFSQVLSKNLIGSVTGALVNSAITGQALDDKSLGQALVSALIKSGSAAGANWIGDNEAALGDFGYQVAHFILGCAGGAATAKADGGCAAGGVGGMVGEMAAKFYNPTAQPDKGETVQFASLMAGIAGALTTGLNGNSEAISIAAAAGANAAENNFLGHIDKARLNDLYKKAKTSTLSKEENYQLVILSIADTTSDNLLTKYRNGEKLTSDEERNLAIYISAFKQQESIDNYDKIIKFGVINSLDYPFAGTIEAKDAYMKNASLNEKLFGRDLPNEQIFIAARNNAGIPLNLFSNEDLTPVGIANSQKWSNLDSLTSMPSPLTSATYLFGRAVGASDSAINDALKYASVASNVIGSAAGAAATVKLSPAPDKNTTTALSNLNVYNDLNLVKDPALNIESIRSALKSFIRDSYFESTTIAAATAKTEDGAVTNLLSVSGKAWKGQPNQVFSVELNGVKYNVIPTMYDQNLGVVYQNNGQLNINHAEMKLAEYIYANIGKDTKAKIDMVIQNTSNSEPGMCFGCRQTIPSLAETKPNLSINIYQGTTGKTGVK